MKNKIIALSLGLFMLVTPAFAFNKEPGFTGWTNKSERSQAATPGTPTVVLKWVRYSATGPNIAGLSSGDAVIYDTNSKDGISVTTTTTSADGSFAGICAAAILSPDASQGGNTPFQDNGKKNWGWIITDGLAVANCNSGLGLQAFGAKDAFITSTDAGKICGALATDKVITSAVYSIDNAKGGFFMTNTDATSSAVVFVKSN